MPLPRPLTPAPLACRPRPCCPTGRYGHGSRYVRPSVARSSVRGSGAQSSDLGLPFERVAIVDEEGRDRTPKPLTMPRSQAAEAAVWGSDGPDSLNSSARDSIRSCVSELPAVGSFLSSSTQGSEMDTAAAQAASERIAIYSTGAVVEVSAPSPLPQEAEVGGSAALEDVGKVWAADLEGPASPTVPASASAGPRRAAKGKGVQCTLLQTASKGCQVAVWELEGGGSSVLEAAPAAADLPEAQQDEDEAAAGADVDADMDAEALEAIDRKSVV